MLIASAVSIMSFYNWFGRYPQAFPPFIAIGLAFILCPLFAWLTKGRYYIARDDSLDAPMMVDGQLSVEVITCTARQLDFERPDVRVPGPTPG